VDAQNPVDYDAKVDEMIVRLGHIEATQAACKIKWESFDELKTDVRAIRDALAPLRGKSPVIINLTAKAGWIAAVIAAILAALGFAV